jgi:outer membrane protein
MKKKMRGALFLLGTVLGLGMSSPFAQTQSTGSEGLQSSQKRSDANPSEPGLKPRLPKWELGVGPGVLSLPDYRGSDQQRAYVLPFPYVAYRGEKIRADRQGIRGHLVDTGAFDLDLSLSAGVPVNSDKNPARTGMPGLKPTVEVGPQAIFRLYGKPTSNTFLSLRLPVRKVFALDVEQFGDPGWVATPNLNLNLRNTLIPQWNVSMGAGAYFGDANHHRYYYGVDSQYATSSRSAYNARGGYGGAQLSFALTRRFDRWWVGGFARASTVSGAVFADSPLVKQNTNWYVGLGAAYVFAQSKDEGVRFDE